MQTAAMTGSRGGRDQGLVGRLLWPSGAGAFRLWLALVVVSHHVTGIEIGKAPVLVFFFLSGYWVEKVWTGRYAGTRAPWWTFMVSRWWRIAPVLLVAAPVAGWALLRCGGTDAALLRAMPWRQVAGAFTVLGYAQLPTRPVGPAWSLDIEMQFYLVVPLLAMLVRRLSPVAVLAAALVVFELGLSAGAGVTLPAFLPWFVLGMVAAHHGWRSGPVAARASFAGTVALAVIIGCGPFAARYVLAGAPDYAGFNLLLAALILPFALSTVQGDATAAAADPVDATLADWSYLVYLLHWPAILVLRARAQAGHGVSWSEYMAAAIVVAVWCHVTWRFVDRPLNAARRRWVAARRVPAADCVEAGERGVMPWTEEAAKRDDSAPIFA